MHFEYVITSNYIDPEFWFKATADFIAIEKQSGYECKHLSLRYCNNVININAENL